MKQLLSQPLAGIVAVPKQSELTGLNHHRFPSGNGIH
jgi:hypothetical protein